MFPEFLDRRNLFAPVLRNNGMFQARVRCVTGRRKMARSCLLVSLARQPVRLPGSPRALRGLSRSLATDPF